MPLWGKAHASTSNKPKFAPVDENSPHNRGDIYATNKGWVRKAGTKASGNGNANAEPEVLVAIGGLSGSSSTTGLRAPTITRTRFVVGTTANTDFTANDANCFALAEATIGAAKKYNVVFGVILGTGCGGGITMLRNIHRGANRIAGEWGHHCLVPGGRECYCGNRGCTEAYISGTALEKEWFELSGERSRVTDIIDSGKYKNHPEWKENFLKNFGRGLANVIDILDPHAIVLGGGLSRIDFLYTEGKESVYKETFSKIVRTPILKNKLGDSAGVFGAAMLADIY